MPSYRPPPLHGVALWLDIDHDPTARARSEASRSAFDPCDQTKVPQEHNAAATAIADITALDRFRHDLLEDTLPEKVLCAAGNRRNRIHERHLEHLPRDAGGPSAQFALKRLLAVSAPDSSLPAAPFPSTHERVPEARPRSCPAWDALCLEAQAGGRQCCSHVAVRLCRTRKLDRRLPRAGACSHPQKLCQEFGVVGEGDRIGKRQPPD